MFQYRFWDLVPITHCILQWVDRLIMLNLFLLHTDVAEARISPAQRIYPICHLLLSASPHALVV